MMKLRFLLAAMVLIVSFSSCKKDKKFRCDNGDCVENVNGEFTSLTKCRSNCEPDEITTYACNGDCELDEDGEYDSRSECEAVCDLKSPELRTIEALDVSSFSMRINASLDELGSEDLEEKGICWAESSGPTIDDQFALDSNLNTGAYSINIGNLNSFTRYFIRAFAKDANGYTYGNEIEVTTIVGPCGTSKTLTYKGYSYDLVEIEDECWLKENLKVTELNDGTPIANITDNALWANASGPAWCYQENNAANDQDFGKLYNNQAFQTAKLCPNGWHVPTEDEMNKVITLAGGDTLGGNAMKLSGADYCDFNPTEVTNSTGLSVVGSGFRSNPVMGGAGNGVFYWLKTSCELRLASGNAIRVNGSGPRIFRLNFNRDDRAMACRCVLD